MQPTRLALFLLGAFQLLLGLLLTLFVKFEKEPTPRETYNQPDQD